MANGSNYLSSDKARFTMALQGYVAGANAPTDAVLDAGQIRYAYNVNNDVPGFTTTNNANGVLTINTHSGDYYHQLGFSSNGGIFHHAGKGTTGWVEIVKNSGSWNINAATATIWETSRTLTIGGTGKSVNGSADVSWSMTEIMGSSDSTKFYRGDKTWSDTLTGRLYLTSVAQTANDHTGQLAITSASTLGSNQYFSSIVAMAPNVGASQHLFMVGTAKSAKNSAYFGFHYDSSGSDNNYATIGLYGVDQIVNVRANGCVGIGTTTPTYKLDVNGTSNFNDNVTIASGKRIGNSGGSLYIGNSDNASWVYIQDVASQDSSKWKLHTNGSAEFTGTVQTGAINNNGDLNLYTGSADSPDIVWWYADKGKEQARLWMGSGFSSKAAPSFREYKSDGTSLYSGCLVLGDGTGASGSWGISVTGSSASCTGNAATATTLQTARNIWGQSFNGSANITGKFLMNGDDGSLAFYTVDGNHGCGNETVVIQSCFDGQDPQTSGYTSSYAGRCNIAIQPRGGQVFIGGVPANGNNKDYKLHVSGNILINSNEAKLHFSSVSDPTNYQFSIISSYNWSWPWSINGYGGCIMRGYYGAAYINLGVVGQKVGIGKDDPAYKLHVNGDFYAAGGKLEGKTYINREQHSVGASAQCGIMPLGILGFKNGYPMFTDPEFASGTNSVGVYNNQGNGSVVITRTTMTNGNKSGYVLQIAKSSTVASPGLGGFVQGYTSRANAIYVQIFRAKIPVGYEVWNAENSQGANASITWLTDQAGTGKWEWYARLVHCGDSGSFSSGGHVYLSKTSSSASDAVTWYLSYCNCFDVTNGTYDGLRVRYADYSDSSGSCSGNAATATRINGNLAAATSNVDRNIWVSSTASADGIPNYISGFNMNPSTKVFTVPSGTRISPSAGALYLGNSGNQSWVYVQDMASQASGTPWKLTQAGVLTCLSINTTGNSYPSIKMSRTDSAETSMYWQNATAGWAAGIHPWGVGAGVFAIGQYSGTGSSTWRLKIDNNGYVYTSSYLNLGGGNEKNNSSPSYVAGFNGSDNFLRSYNTGYLDVNSSAKLRSTGYNTTSLSYLQTDASFDGASGWAHYIIGNHGDGSTYYHYTLRLPFWGPPQYKRQEGNTSSGKGWYTFISTEQLGADATRGLATFQEISINHYEDGNHNQIIRFKNGTELFNGDTVGAIIYGNNARRFTFRCYGTSGYQANFLLPSLNTSANTNYNILTSYSNGWLANVNLNSYTDTGFYGFSTGCSNSPGDWFGCFVFNCQGCITQIGHVGATGQIAMRGKVNSSWTAWKKV